MRVVLDTDAVSLLLRKDPVALARLSRLDPEDVVLVAPVHAEIRYGLERLPAASRRRRLLEAGFEVLRGDLAWLDWTEAAAVEFGRQKARLERQGRRIEDMDLAIASIALAAGLRLATADVRHMARIDGLELDDWSG